MRAHAGFLRHGCQLIQGLAALAIGALFVVQHIAIQHPAMAAHLAMGDLAFVQQLDQIRARHIQQVSGFLRSQLGMDGGQGDGIATSHLGQRIQQQL